MSTPRVSEESPLHSEGHWVGLHTDATAVLSSWAPTSPDAAGARDRTLGLLTDGPVAMRREHRVGHVTASALVFDATGSRVLLCLHGKFHRWVQLGGHCEPGDRTLAGAALREATEESGIADLRIDPVPIDVDVHAVGCQGGSLHYDVRFAVFAPAGAVEQVSAESEALGWFPPDQLPHPLAGGTAQLVAPGLAALRRASPHPAP
ncbi:8-oxo-dGTP pyrophosphatase MutT, NUDIX family [Micromonospora phaseoli]|uniref:8-oxo-dGTP pyrophosphatase MutT, NUDIX family n=1 Tax=Micromonospora phaseoli TaxID=1144548 RepID=A0A1H7A9P5_9ACTN|nr:NUDIX domain-containing protein [Micromonospora phaseoli]PZV96976.1 8-oxo-dGTP pyrophosphatase MutT (NUDIX family) [Micromonospora phaseoli]GIJ77952.1 NUDIX hydrolase [Micromonospora phaseoli]SEJ57735.1 8-oxo-dGTP pyrophosphatase MutT, NUDIX family [Micromonospora phaseoli]